MSELYLPPFASRGFSRRSFLGGAAGAALLLAGCSSETGSGNANRTFANDAEKWKQYDGKKLTFITENTPPSSGIKAIVDRGDFKKLTGIDVEILQNDLPVMLQKAELDLRSGGTAYDLVYTQDKPVTSVIADFFEDLRPYLEDDSLPQIEGGYGEEAWYPNYLDVASFAYSDRLIGLPYDAADSVFCYRRDLFEQYSGQFEDEFGYPMEYGPDTTWKNVLEFATFFNQLHAKDAGVPFGVGLHLGQFAWTTQLDIQRILYSHGQWREFDIDDVQGSKEPGPTRWGDEQSVRGLELYKALFDQSTPDALSLGTVEVADAYNAGKIAMVPQFHEFAASFEDPANAGGGGKTAYDICPKGDKEYLVGKGDLVNGTNCGIGGISINAAASEDQKRAAYLFIIWATSLDVQTENLKVAGGAPTRAAVGEVPDIEAAQGTPYGTGDTGRVGPSDYPNALTFPAVNVGMADPNAVLGPKIPKFNQYVTIVANEIQKMCAGDNNPEKTAKAIQTQVDELHGV
ncbi:extracellular solute-binding protein [Blastococcus sp. CT_GayMR19]|uniref:extracellular solute-binding protein n=1 Tax=Blastococcus sp. CT_GayMR19 TaxID=2559608 RepID=UPI0010735C46|nr:extracellular solute-binding protein [Blastococcus sp. CT_GayMR19]TFV71041.1 extracellular solute-binding protein [Blastococcus sp. CT_GayMR19]